MENKEKVRPVLAELKGYQSAAPDPEKGSRLFDDHFWKQYNSTIDELNTITGSDYNKFKLQPQAEDWNGRYITMAKTQDYVSKLSGLINRVSAEYFSDEKSSISGPSTVINTHQTQSQSQQQSMVVDIAMFIAEKKSDYAKGTKERVFLEKAGEAIKETKNVTDIISTIISIATACGLSLPALAKIFGIM